MCLIEAFCPVLSAKEGIREGDMGFLVMGSREVE